MRYDRKYQCVQLALELMSKKSNNYYYIAPVRNRSTGHWYLVEVLFQDAETEKDSDRLVNGMINFIDFCPHPITEASPEYHATMWYAKFFGMLMNFKTVQKNPKVLSYVADMNPVEFKLCENCDTNDRLLITTLDHQSTTVSNQIGSVKNKPNPLSSIHTAMYMLDIHQDTYKNIAKVKGSDKGDIDDKSIDLFKVNMMNCIMNILMLFHPNNHYLYIPGDHDCDDNPDFWIQTRKEVSSSSDLLIKDLWKTMFDKCQSAKNKLPKNVGSKVSIKETCTS